ncbi:MAG TPA: YqeG family HAD IIIA-type phosphatase [Bacillota bacterium]|nr:YqeG family HAD IIIA-type phosphatase [Bacillota bacterium]
MGEGLKPDLLIQNIEELTFDFLGRQGLEGIIVDMDNTILPWVGKDIPQSIRQWFSGLQRRGIRFCILSNGTSRRVHKLAGTLGVPAISKAIKPRRKAFRRALNLLGTTSSNTAVIGDQLFTDVWGGNRLDLFTILVSPLNKREFIGTMLVRQVEKWVLNRGRHRIS